MGRGEGEREERMNHDETISNGTRSNMISREPLLYTLSTRNEPTAIALLMKQFSFIQNELQIKWILSVAN